MMLSRDKASRAVVDYIVTLEYARDKVRKNFEEMDLEHVTLRRKMEEEIIAIEEAVNFVIKELYAMVFE